MLGWFIWDASVKGILWFDRVVLTRRFSKFLMRLCLSFYVYLDCFKVWKRFIKWTNIVRGTLQSIRDFSIVKFQALRCALSLLWLLLWLFATRGARQKIHWLCLQIILFWIIIIPTNLFRQVIISVYFLVKEVTITPIIIVS